jgi:hypothetical protein
LTLRIPAVDIVHRLKLAQHTLYSWHSTFPDLDTSYCCN